ncbi:MULTISPECIES: hypothetical protein [Enterobacteriaceae]|uniref:hypothetical protein n=1 Tax=Enterobacteriaceae TaxID=543 RepID=UPI00073D5F48|nr:MULTISPECIES: hypothetical protein [Enterobacteriaceae]
MDKDMILIWSALIAFAGVIISAGINLWINNINRDKSRNEWKRDKLLKLTNEFIEVFYKDIKNAIANGEGSGISNVQFYVPTLFSSSEQALYQLCMLLDAEASKKAYEQYSDMKRRASDFVTDRILKMYKGDFEAQFETMKSNEVRLFIQFISSEISKLK